MLPAELSGQSRLYRPWPRRLAAVIPHRNRQTIGQVFNVVPTALEIGIVCAILAHNFGWQSGGRPSVCRFVCLFAAACCTVAKCGAIPCGVREGGS
jgi:hypothetical protein